MVINFSTNEMIDFLISIGYNTKVMEYLKYESVYHNKVIKIPTSSQIFYKEDSELTNINSENIGLYELENVFNKEVKNRILKLII